MDAPQTRPFRLIWLCATIFFIGVCLFPTSNTATRTAGIALFLFMWGGLLILQWRRTIVRYSLIAITILAALFLCMPARSLQPADALRADYVKALQHYGGVRYFWGGESPIGIDCSGLARRGLVDAFALRGLRTGDPGLIRRSIALWWNDCNAKTLAAGNNGRTTALGKAESINEIGPSRLLPGDLAFAGGGMHVLIYIGDARWIESDPTLGRVLTVDVPSSDNAWFKGPVTLGRWNVLTE